MTSIPRHVTAQRLLLRCLMALTLVPVTWAQQTPEDLLQEAITVIEAKNAVIESQNRDIANLQTSIKLRERLVEQLNFKSRELEALIAAYKEGLSLKEDLKEDSKLIETRLEQIRIAEANIRMLRAEIKEEVLKGQQNGSLTEWGVAQVLITIIGGSRLWWGSL